MSEEWKKEFEKKYGSKGRDVYIWEDFFEAGWNARGKEIDDLKRKLGVAKEALEKYVSVSLIEQINFFTYIDSQMEIEVSPGLTDISWISKQALKEIE